MRKVLESYDVDAAGLIINVSIVQTEDFVPIYEVKLPYLGPGTKTVLDQIRLELIKKIVVKTHEISDIKALEALQKKFKEKTRELIETQFPDLKKPEKDTLVCMLLNEMFGLCEVEVPLHDDNLEEIAINNAKEPIWVYHRKYGWLKTTITLPTEEKILDYANLIGRKIGRQITVLDPLMDAHLVTGDRVNATLFPISSKGNTITIRKFARKPWTITDFIKLNTLNEQVASLLWLCVQYELNVLVSGGAGSGKTSVLNTMMPFIQPNQRVISIEETRELNLPIYLHWIPLTTRPANPEGKGEVSMLDLMINSLRMRPDRLVVGEVRRQREAEVLFEAAHTGHSVYSTIHADRAEELKRRLITPPISLPESLLEAIHLVLIQYRHRRLGIRRTLELAEVLPVARAGEVTGVDFRILYKWMPRTDKIVKEKDSMRLSGEIEILTGLTEKEVSEDLAEKQKILKWMVEKNINEVNKVGKLMALYYRNKPELMEFVEKNKAFE